MFASGLMPATTLTTLARMITRAGGQGLKDLAKDPTPIRNNAAKFLQNRLGIRAIKKYLLLWIQVPVRIARCTKAS